MSNPHRGSTFDDWLQEEGIYEDVATGAIKRVLAAELSEAMTDSGISQAELARRMNTSRATVHRLLNPRNTSVTLKTISAAATVLGRQLDIHIRPAQTPRRTSKKRTA